MQITASSPALPTNTLLSFSSSSLLNCQSNSNINANDKANVTSELNFNFNSNFITPTKIKEIVASMNNKPSCGVDGMPYRVIKLFDVKLFDYFAILFNQIIAAGYFPLCWKHALVIPIPKPGKASANVSNWRPISLLNCLSKILERIVAEKMMSFIADNNIIPNHQFGFRPAHSTCHPLAILQNKVNGGLNNKMITTVISLDIKAAFDTVWHDGLIFKLYKLNFPNFLIFIINSFLRDRTFQVRYSNSISDRHSIKAGVPQGSVLGPLLFNLSNHDIPRSEHFTLLQYADDTAIAISYPRIHRIEKYINTYLSQLSEWYMNWKFQLNENKTELVHFVGTQDNVSWIRRRRLKQMKVILNGVEISPKSEIKYLGVIFSRNNRFNKQVSAAIQKTMAAKSKLGAIVHSQFLKTDFKRFLYTVYLRPMLTYAAPIVYNPSQITSFQMERFRVLERKLIRCTHNIYRRRGSLRYLNNKKLYKIFGYQRIDVYMAKLSINFHMRCSSNMNPEIRKLFSAYSTNVNFAAGYFHRTDYIANLHESGMLFGANEELSLFNKKKVFSDESVYSLAQ